MILSVADVEEKYEVCMKTTDDRRRLNAKGAGTCLAHTTDALGVWSVEFHITVFEHESIVKFTLFNCFSARIHPKPLIVHLVHLGLMQGPWLLRNLLTILLKP